MGGSRIEKVKLNNRLEWSSKYMVVSLLYLCFFIYFSHKMTVIKHDDDLLLLQNAHRRCERSQTQMAMKTLGLENRQKDGDDVIRKLPSR